MRYDKVGVIHQAADDRFGFPEHAGQSYLHRFAICELDGKEQSYRLPPPKSLTKTEEEGLRKLMFQRVDKILAPGDKKYRSKIEDFKMTPLARDKFGDKYLFESNTTIAENKDCFSSIHFMFVASVSEKRETKLVFETVGKEEKCPSASYGAQFKVLSFGDIRRSGSLDILTYIDDVIAPCIFIDEGDGYVNAGCFEGFGGC